MSEDGLELTVYLGERDRAGERFLADALVDVFAAHALRGSVILRGASGFGAKHRLRSDRLLTLSEDLPVVAVAVDTRARVLAALPDVERAGRAASSRSSAARGWSTATRRREEGEAHALRRPPRARGLGARLRGGRRPAAPPRRGGRDGAARRRRHPPRHPPAGAAVRRNGDVPLMIVSVGEAERLAAALAELGTLLAAALTWERVRVCKRDGQRLAERSAPTTVGRPGQKLTVYASEQSRRGRAASRRLRCAAGAAGATALRGHWGYHGDHAPHGDLFWQLRRRVPVVTVVVDTPANIAALVRDRRRADAGDRVS